MIHKKIWDPEFAKALQESNMKQKAILNGEARRQAVKKHANQQREITPLDEKEYEYQKNRRVGQELRQP